MAGMSWEPFELDGMNCAWVRPHRGHDRRRAILYCHGGGYTSGNLGYSRILASKLANVTGWQVLSFEYRLAPEHPYPAAVEERREGLGLPDVPGLRRRTWWWPATPPAETWPWCSPTCSKRPDGGYPGPSFSSPRGQI